jgi:hypothetical protein
LRLALGAAVLGIAFGFFSDALGGQWMRVGTAIMGATLLPFGLLILTNFGGEYEHLVSLLARSNDVEMAPRERPEPGLRYGLGAFIVLVGIVFLAAGIAGGRGVTKPGLF